MESGRLLYGHSQSLTNRMVIRMITIIVMVTIFEQPGNEQVNDVLGPYFSSILEMSTLLSSGNFIKYKFRHVVCYLTIDSRECEFTFANNIKCVINPL